MNQPTQFDIEAEKLVGTVIKACYDIEQTKPGVIKVVDEALSQLHNLYVQGQIEELKTLRAKHSRTYTQKVTDSEGNVYVDESHGYISSYETQERIATLEAELTNNMEG